MFVHTAGAQEPGLGLIDAFFASLSMILVSEVRLQRRRRAPLGLCSCSCVCMVLGTRF
jgi:hypothetical protein